MAEFVLVSVPFVLAFAMLAPDAIFAIKWRKLVRKYGVK